MSHNTKHKPTPAAVPPPNQRIYKMALYGRSGSGKTCLMAALAMDRYSNPSGFEATWLTHSNQTGKAWLEQAIRALEHNQVPEGNSIESESLAFDFEFAHMGKTYLIRLFDYAGELLSSQATDSENAVRLRNALKDMDALLILAPAPHPGEDHKEISKDLLDLRRTFASFNQELSSQSAVPSIPIALLYNMWDRRSELEHETPETEWAELEEYLQLPNQNPVTPIPHRNLHDALESVLVPTPNSYQTGDLWRIYNAFITGTPILRNFMPFPLSAFGEYATVTREDGISFERPKEINPLHSFGLEDPFFWALYRRQEIEAEVEDQTETAIIQKLEQSINRLEHLPIFLRLFNLPTLWKLRRETNALVQRLATPGADMRRYEPLQTRRNTRKITADTLSQRLNNITNKELFATGPILLIISLLLILGLEFAWDSTKLAGISDLAQNAPLPEQRQQAELEIEAYIRSPVWQHTLYSMVWSRGQATQELKVLREIRMDRLVEIFNNPNAILSERVKAAQTYLEKYDMQGTHSPQAETVLQEYIKNQDQAAWDKATLDNTEASINNYLAVYPLGRYAETARTKLKDLLRAKELLEFKQRYLAAIKAADIIGAAQLLTDRPVGPEPSVANFRAEFPNFAAEELAKKIAVWKKHQDWTTAIDYLNQVRQISGMVWNSETRLQLVNTWKTDITTAWDQSLYAAVLQQPTPETINTYLTQAPLKTMRGAVESYLMYLDSKTKPLQFQLTLQQVSWSDKAVTRPEAVFRLVVQDQYIQSPRLAVGPGTKDTADLDLQLKFKAKESADIEVGVGAVGYGGWTFWNSETFLGACENAKLTLNASTDPQIKLTLKDREGLETGTVTLVLQKSVVEPPDLPAWQQAPAATDR
ncbi:hypothetical protein TI04_02060 [Achromatium sp. WMS2]|nr:hypothetical protein TI04_02060 [Achromatium sp. WMS2]